MDAIRYLDASEELRSALSGVSVLYTDLDGTLVAPGGSVLADAEGAPSAITAEAIVALNAAGLTVVPVSGREDEQLWELARLLGWDAYIAEAGAIIVRGLGLDNEVTFNTGEWPSDLVGPGQPSPYERIDASGAFEMLAAAFPGRIEAYGAGPVTRKATHLLRGCLDVAEAQAVLARIEPPIDIVDNGALRWRGALACGDATPHAYHLVPRGVSKRGAIELDLASRGLTCAQAAIIGDAPSDLGAAPAVAVAALVENALGEPGIAEALAAHPNAAVVRGARGKGWAEFARLWLDARGA